MSVHINDDTQDWSTACGTWNIGDNFANDDTLPDCQRCRLMHASWFVTKASDEETQFSSGMKRDSNKGKPRFDLIVPEGVPYQEQLLYRFAALMARGAELRGDRNWENADSEADLSRFRESAFRHFFQWYCGETDEDHLVGFLFNAQGAEFVKRKLKGVSDGSP